MVAFYKKFRDLKPGEVMEFETEDYRGQISRAAYNAGLTQKKIFSTRRFEGYIYVVRVF